MSRHDRYILSLVLARWGFAALVAVAIVAGLVAGVTVEMPDKVPSVALGAAPVFRVEVAAAVFLGIYLGALAFGLALHNRGFTEIGSGGVKASELAAVGEDPTTDLLEALTEEVAILRNRVEGSHDAR
jgi:uncharacterized membrane protein